MRTTCLTCAVLLLATGAAGAETLYNQDGVQLSATARVIDPGGATCRIREERHSAEEYEKLKPNHGQPLNVWRVELVVANYSGKVLDYLSAHLNVESVFWTWRYPDGSDGIPWLLRQRQLRRRPRRPACARRRAPRWWSAARVRRRPPVRVTRRKKALRLRCA